MTQMPVAAIVVPDGRRTLRPTASLEASMASSIGQMYPILVNIRPGTPTLIAGHHRLVAARNLGWESIDVSVKDVSPDEAALMEIDDNLEHNSLTAVERCCQLAERKGIYLRLHPETKRGVAGGKASGVARGTTAPDAVVPDESSFVADTAAKTGMADRTIRKYVQVGEILGKSGAGELLIGTPVAGRQKELDYLAKMEPEKQKAIASLIKSGECSSVYEAEKKLKGIPDRTSEECNILVLDMLETGASMAEIAAELGVHRNSLDHRIKTKAFLAMQAARSRQAENPGSPSEIPQPIIDEEAIIEDAPADPWSEFPPAPESPPKKVCSRDAETVILELYRSGVKTPEIAERTGFSWDTITKYILPIETERIKKTGSDTLPSFVSEEHNLAPLIQDLHRLHTWILSIHSTQAFDLSIPASLILQALQSVEKIQEAEKPCPTQSPNSRSTSQPAPTGGSTP